MQKDGFSIRPFLSPERLNAILDGFPSLHIAVLGDFFVDKYLLIDPSLAELSLETGLETRQVVSIRCSPGAAGTVTNNLSALCVGKISALGVIGDDGQGYELIKGLQATGVRTNLLIQAPGRFTPTYTKPMLMEADGERELERLDIKNRTPTSVRLEVELLSRLVGLLANPKDRPHAVILQDQVDQPNCGAMTERVRDRILEIAVANPNVRFFADSRSNIGAFTGVAIKPNVYEAARALGTEEPENLETGLDIAKRLHEQAGQAVFLTLGSKGMIVCEDSGQASLVPALPVEGPLDIVGAGDSASAGIVSALCAGAGQIEAAMIGNLCASVTIRKLGTTGTVTPDEIVQAAEPHWNA